MHLSRFALSGYRVVVVSLLAACVIVLPARPETPSSSTAELMIVFDPAVPNEPATDAPARVVEVHEINLPASSSAKTTDGIKGRMAVRVLEDGSVGRVRFEAPRPPKNITTEIETGITRWRFTPLTRGGKSVEAWVPLVYSSAPSPVPGADTPARSLFAVLPDYPIELWRPWARVGAAAPVVSLPGDNAPASRSGGSSAPVGDNMRVSVAPGRTPLGSPGSGPSPASHAAWFSGHVTLRVDIDEHGLVTGAEAVRSTASCFEPLAAASVLNWRFAPSIAAGQPVATRMIVPIATPGAIENPPPLFFKPAPDEDLVWDEPPRMRFLDLPVYPQDLLAAKVTGRASAEVELDASGAITRVDLIEATRPEFGHALIASIERCQHDPARKAGRRVPVTLIRTAVFDRELWNKKPVTGETPALVLASADPPVPVTEDKLDQPLHRVIGKPPAFALAPADETISATVEFVVARDGEVLTPRIVASSTPSAGYAAVQAVATWRYAPPVSRGEQVPVVVQAAFASR